MIRKVLFEIQLAYFEVLSLKPTYETNIFLVHFPLIPIFSEFGKRVNNNTEKHTQKENSNKEPKDHIEEETEAEKIIF